MKTFFQIALLNEMIGILFKMPDTFFSGPAESSIFKLVTITNPQNVTEAPLDGIIVQINENDAPGELNEGEERPGAEIVCAVNWAKMGLNSREEAEAYFMTLDNLQVTLVTVRV